MHVQCIYQVLCMLAETNALLNVFDEDVGPDSVTLVCILANVSYGLSCSLP